jgi:hypothetical protein
LFRQRFLGSFGNFVCIARMIFPPGKAVVPN